MQYVVAAIALISGIGIILAVMFQSKQADGFSAALGGADSSQFKAGSAEERLDKLAKVASVVWIIACIIGALLWYAGR